jgi:phosphate/sulfate permease
MSGLTASEWLTMIINTALPIVVALVTSRFADGAVKALVLLALSALSGVLVGVLAAVNAGLPVDWSHVLFTAVVGYVVAAVAHFNLWKPLGVTGSNGVIQVKAPAGIGASAARDAA